MRLLTLIVLEHFQDKQRHCKRSAVVVDPLMDRATRNLLIDLLITLLKQEERAGNHFLLPLETIARVVGWTLQGIATNWYEEGSKLPIEEIADNALVILTEGLNRIVRR